MAIDRKKIIEQMRSVKVLGDAEGVIQWFNVCVNVMPITFWNGFAERITGKSDEEPARGSRVSSCERGA
jgi:hypothetical protein